MDRMCTLTIVCKVLHQDFKVLFIRFDGDKLCMREFFKKIDRGVTDICAAVKDQFRVLL